jgi:thioredoxin 1
MNTAVVIRIAAGLVLGAGLGALLGYLGRCSTGACPLTGSPWRGAIFGGLIGVLFSFQAAPAATGDVEAPPPTGVTATAASGKDLDHIGSVDQFTQDVLGAKVPVLVDFYSDSCPPCRALAPTIASLASRYQGRALVCKVNVDRLPQLAQRYNITAIPTVIFFSKGRETERLVGLHSQASYAEVLDRMASGAAG